jgi:hypothetical protein
MSESEPSRITLSEKDIPTELSAMASDDPFADIAQDFEVNDHVFTQTQYIVIDPDQGHELLSTIYPSDPETLARHNVALNALVERARAKEAQEYAFRLPEWVVPKVKTTTLLPENNPVNNALRFIHRGIVPAEPAVPNSIAERGASELAGQDFIFPKQKSVSESILAPDMTKLDFRPEDWMRTRQDVCHQAISSTGDLIRVPADEYLPMLEYTDNGKTVVGVNLEKTTESPLFDVTGFAVMPMGLKRAIHHDRGVSSMTDVLNWYGREYSPEQIVAKNKQCAKSLRSLQTLMRMHGYDETAITASMISNIRTAKQERVPIWDANAATSRMKDLYVKPVMPKLSEIRSTDNGRYYYQGILSDYIKATKTAALPKRQVTRHVVATDAVLSNRMDAMVYHDGSAYYLQDGKYYDTENYNNYRANKMAAALEGLTAQVTLDRETNKGALARSLDSITYRSVKRSGTYDKPMITEQNAGEQISGAADDQVYQMLRKLDLETRLGRQTFIQLVDIFRSIGKITIANGQYVTTGESTHICCSHEIYDYREGLSNLSDEEILNLDFGMTRNGVVICKYCEKVLSEVEDVGAAFSASSQIMQITGRAMLLGKDVTIGREDTELYKFLIAVTRVLHMSPMAVPLVYDYIAANNPLAAGVYGDTQYIELFQLLNIGGELDEDTVQSIWTRLQNFIKSRTVPAIAARMTPFVKSLQAFIDDVEDDTPTEITKSYTKKLQAIYAMYMVKECCYRIAVLLRLSSDVVPDVTQDQIITIYNTHCKQMKALCLAGLRDRTADVQAINKFAAIFSIELTPELVKQLLPVFSAEKSLAAYLEYRMADITIESAEVAEVELLEESDRNCVPYVTDTMHGFYSKCNDGQEYLVALRNRYQRTGEFERENIGGPTSKTSYQDTLNKYQPLVDGEKMDFPDMINRKIQTEKDLYMSTLGYAGEFTGGETILVNAPKTLQSLPAAINNGYKGYNKNQEEFAKLVSSFELTQPLPTPSADIPLPEMTQIKKYMINAAHRKDTVIPYEVIPPAKVEILPASDAAVTTVIPDQDRLKELESVMLGGHPFSQDNNFKAVTNIRSWIESQIDQQRMLVSSLKLVVPNAVKEEQAPIKTTNRDFIRFNRAQSLGKQLVSIHQALNGDDTEGVIFSGLSKTYIQSDYTDFKLRWYTPVYRDIYHIAYGTEGVTTDTVIKAVLCDIYSHAVKIRTGAQNAMRAGLDVLTMHMPAFNLSDNISIHNRYLNFVAKIFELMADYMDILDINHTVMEDQEYKHYFRAVKITAPRKLDLLERKDTEQATAAAPALMDEEEDAEADDPDDEDADTHEYEPRGDEEHDREDEEDAVGDYENEFGNMDEAGDEMELDDRD